MATGVASEATDAAIQVGGFPLVFPRRARAWLSNPVTWYSNMLALSDARRVCASQANIVAVGYSGFNVPSDA